MSSNFKSLFITFEGGEGSGKTTQITRLKDYIESKGVDVTLTREPGGTEEAEKIRNLLVQRDGGDWTPIAEALLFFAARNMHVEHLIKPSLQKGNVVISDRFTDSSRAYQGYGHGFDLGKIQALVDLAIDGLEPDITFILDIPVETGLARAGKRMEDDESQEDRFERLDLSFHEKLRQGYLDIANKNPHRCIVIDANRSIEDIYEDIIDKINERTEQRGAA